MAVLAAAAVGDQRPETTPSSLWPGAPLSRWQHTQFRADTRGKAGSGLPGSEPHVAKSPTTLIGKNPKAVSGRGFLGSKKGSLSESPSVPQSRHPLRLDILAPCLMAGAVYSISKPKSQEPLWGINCCLQGPLPKAQRLVGRCETVRVIFPSKN